MYVTSCTWYVDDDDNDDGDNDDNSFVSVAVLRPSKHIKVMSSAVSLRNHSFPGMTSFSNQLTSIYAHSFARILESAEGRE